MKPLDFLAAVLPFAEDIYCVAEFDSLKKEHVFVSSFSEMAANAERINEARLKMADVPDGAELIHNPVSKAPGFRMGNVYVMAGVPSIRRTISRASAGLSLTPLSMTYSKVIRRALFAVG